MACAFRIGWYEELKTENDHVSVTVHESSRPGASVLQDQWPVHDVSSPSAGPPSRNPQGAGPVLSQAPLGSGGSRAARLPFLSVHQLGRRWHFHLLAPARPSHEDTGSIATPYFGNPVFFCPGQDTPPPQSAPGCPPSLACAPGVARASLSVPVGLVSLCRGFLTTSPPRGPAQPRRAGRGKPEGETELCPGPATKARSQAGSNRSSWNWAGVPALPFPSGKTSETLAGQQLQRMEFGLGSSESQLPPPLQCSLQVGVRGEGSAPGQRGLGWLVTSRRSRALTAERSQRQPAPGEVETPESLLAAPAQRPGSDHTLEPKSHRIPHLQPPDPDAGVWL
ncbi:uncharacterized protein LOC118925021 [Manis pentadactyla]|uniref:uncharacterized protein LOC118925021 n=1 Tax=Manis pentadactyla TaxID=143292 RepID=UPI00255C47B0|nr:uncharacterized protein LOC118925021 [Manis pentadactyla]